MERNADGLDQAQGNLAHAESDVDRGIYDWACFSAHQAAEMAVEAVFERQGAVARGRSVADLLADRILASHPDTDVVDEPDPDGDPVDALRVGALELDKACIPTR